MLPLSHKNVSTGRCILIPREAKPGKPLGRKPLGYISFLFLLAALHGFSALTLVRGLKGHDSCRCWSLVISPGRTMILCTNSKKDQHSPSLSWWDYDEPLYGWGDRGSWRLSEHQRLPRRLAVHQYQSNHSNPSPSEFNSLFRQLGRVRADCTFPCPPVT